MFFMERPGVNVSVILYTQIVYIYTRIIQMTLYISNDQINNHQPLQKRISAIDYHSKRLWTIGLEPCDSFIIDSYGFDRFIFFIDQNDIDKIWDLPNKKVFVVLKNCTDQVDALYQIGTDININIRCYFSDFIDQIVDEIL
tara:strand:- start:479 stop:901 length:423 start_codon:yes stop_codon:yes gene_type:complete